MFVKRLEIHGFKSFADKTTLELAPGITVVVGPNGCGKSNITDAVRWVLGEQSARYLRGQRMDDIIFGGTASRKALSFAEVSITLDNSDCTLGLDYQEITVTRRIYRSGESEYLLNKRPCRLKDIVELFMDTGIGREAYSFIGQGKVDEIIHARPDERRQIFEEAAGIIKYKTRKREAERRLAETAENLLRVGDIIHELSNQLGPLSEQAKTAREYLTLRDKLKKREVDVLVHDAHELRSRWYETDEKARAAADELLARQAAVAHRENRLTENQLALDEEQVAVSASQREAQRLTAELEKIQGRIAVTEEKIRGVERQLKEGTAYLTELDSQNAALLAKKQEVTRQTECGREILRHVQDELAASQRLLDCLEASPEALRSIAVQDELEKLLPEIRRIQLESDRLVMELEQLAEKKQALTVQREEKTSERDILNAQGQALLAEKERLVREKQELKKEISAESTKLSQALAEAGKLLSLQDLQRSELADAQNKLRVLTELEEAMGGFYQGVKTVLTAKKEAGRFAGILGTVADIMHVPPAYVTAVEAAMGTALQNLVAEEDQVAKEAIAYLKKVKGGRATFLPLNLLDVPPRRQAAEPLASLSGYIGIGADLVTADNRFKAVIESVLGRVHLVQSLDGAVPVARALRFRERVVTLDGDVISPGGAMSGGLEKKQGGVLTRRKEAEALKELIRSKAEELVRMEREAESFAARQQEITREIAVLEEGSRRLDVSLGIKENELAYLARQAEAAAGAVHHLEAELEAVEKRYLQRSALSETATQQVRALSEKESSLRVELAQMSGVLSAREQEKRSLREQYTEYRVRLASVQKQQERHEEELERIGGEAAQITARRRQKEDEMRILKTQRLDLDSALAEGKEGAAALTAERHRILAGLVERENTLKERTTHFREETEQLRQLEKSLSGFERKQARLDMEKSRVEVELQTLLDRLRESWELEFTEAEKLAKPLDNKGAAQEEIRALKEQISLLGTVNLGAIDEFERVSERVDFLTAQRDDLQEGEADLLRIIREIDSRMGEKFASSFAVINEHFGIVFKELFGGGRAHLRLIDPDNPLESGVDIVAQPPGKKLQHMSLLSGGEKAMTAIALLFAFLKVRPSPFCILDEIEAALDEANLGRFTEYLRSLSDGTQFILISHRKKTMEQADILYGVTMEESGVSKQISVRLRKAQEQVSGATA